MWNALNTMPPSLDIIRNCLSQSSFMWIAGAAVDWHSVKIANNDMNDLSMLCVCNTFRRKKIDLISKGPLAHRAATRAHETSQLVASNHLP